MSGQTALQAHPASGLSTRRMGAVCLVPSAKLRKECHDLTEENMGTLFLPLPTQYPPNLLSDPLPGARGGDSRSSLVARPSAMPAQ